MCGNDEHKDNGNGLLAKEHNIIRSSLHCPDYWMIENIDLFRNDVKVDLNREMNRLAKCHHKHVPSAVMIDGKPVEQNANEEVVIEMKAAGSRKYRCPHCGHLASIYDYRVRTLTHCDYLGRKCTLIVSVPRLDCKECGILEMDFPGAKVRVTYTYAFEKQAIIEAYKQSLSAAARTLHIGRWIISDILNNHIEDAIAVKDLSYVTEIYVDDFYLGKKLGYVTIISDQFGNIIYITKKRDSSAIERFANYLLAHGGHPDNIRVVSADMSRAYESGVRDYLQNARLVWDRFHIVKSINDVLNEIRRNVIKRKKGEKLGSIRYVILRRADNMDDKCKAKLDEIRLRSPELALAFDMKEAFCNILSNTDYNEAVADFEEWYAWVMSVGSKKMRERAELYKANIDKILAWIDHPVSNSVAEGVNSRIRKVIGQSYGFRNIDSFVSICLFKLGELSIYV